MKHLYLSITLSLSILWLGMCIHFVIFNLNVEYLPAEVARQAPSPLMLALPIPFIALASWLTVRCWRS